jgi:hypothetical protein
MSTPRKLQAPDSPGTWRVKSPHGTWHTATVRREGGDLSVCFPDFSPRWHPATWITANGWVTWRNVPNKKGRR